ncbi:uncharacterized protein B0T15DRAFT_507537 [Chaetomium strumarium]|uniref:Uncharacterized protein n=1 Tax=Chaetomium strumarium TaxID=1170767 RepID=A0AAJ0H3K8_9PEZI|nr:hypothetical protein B0T15DRAFT_507537 [Chaetomium strumarium]
MAPPIVTATIQTAVISAVSNILAQAITAHQNSTSLKIDFIPVFQYVLFALMSTPPNFLWQEFLEGTWPAYGTSNDNNNDKKEQQQQQQQPPRLNKRNTLTKTLLDQTLGAAVNTVLFSVFMHGIRQGMGHHYVAVRGEGEEAAGSWAALLGRDAVRYADVNWAAVWESARGEFWDLVRAGWRFWPFVSLVNYVFLTSVEARSLVGALAGLGWGVYVSLYTGN